ncbi:hypothetical protein [uncultured Roseobacter sp.]|uniref:hypothetical protein n=1 Tax=uncultured Roseobacter sp. TaxID=114847 RepID=UPI0026326420|nr:hypothetical protein [uncultured Roseobacter sp.]
MRTGLFAAAFGLAALLVVLLAALAGQNSLAAALAGSGETARKLVLLTGAVYLISVVVAASGINHQTRSAEILHTLQLKSCRAHYTRALEHMLTRARRWVRIPKPATDRTPVSELLRTAFTFRLLNRALLFAVIYPLTSMLIYWGTSGQDGVLGQTILIPAAASWWHGLLALAVILLIAGGPQYIRMGNRYLTGRLEPLGDYMDLAAFALGGTILMVMDFPWFTTTAILAIGFALLWTLAGHFAGLSAIAVSAVISLAPPLGFGLQWLLPGAGAFFLAAIAAMIAALIYVITIDVLRTGNRPGVAAGLALGIPAAAVVLMLLLAPWNAAGEWLPVLRVTLLFLVVAPLVNALFDVASYAVTLALAERGRQGQPLIWGALDALVAVLLFLATGSTLVCVSALMEVLSGIRFVNLERLLESTWNLSKYWWLYLMLASTLLPTAVHIGLGALSLQPLLPKGLRDTLCTRITAARRGDTRASVTAPFRLGAVWTACLVLVFGGLALLLRLLWDLGLAWVVVWYRQWLDALVVWAGVVGG